MDETDELLEHKVYGDYIRHELCISTLVHTFLRSSDHRFPSFVHGVFRLAWLQLPHALHSRT